MTGSTRRPGQHLRRLAPAVHALRVGVVAALLLAIPRPTVKQQLDAGSAPPIDRIPFGDRFSATGGLRILSEQDAAGMWRVVDADETVAALVARTLPEAEDVVGYRGPTEAVILLDKESLQILAVGVLNSADTKEHIEAVVEDRAFLRQFVRWPWGGPPSDTRIDAVSGATLTSLALAEGVLERIGGARPSLVFRDSISPDEITDWFPQPIAFDASTGLVRNQQGELLGRVFRSGPHSDDLVGYQGPSEMLLKLSPEDRIESIKLRRSFDNEPYVDYVRVEAGFWAIFEGKTLTELADFVPADAGVEGVSGATMTSLAVADTLVAAAQRVVEADKEQPPPKSWLAAAGLESVRWTRADVATMIALLLTGLLSRLGWFHHRMARRIWSIAVVVVIGLWSGNLISLALIAGWSAEGVAWQLAPGLATITLSALLLPPLTKGNPYCNHLCPHGALQQLVRPGSRSRRRLNISRSKQVWLKRIPGATLIIAYLALITAPTIDLSSWEPFHAYLFRIASWGSIALAASTLAISAVIPMGYCRLGCPTGRLIDHLRRSASSHSVELSDIVAIGLLGIAITMRLLE